jgi:hypothetical protein
MNSGENIIIGPRLSGVRARMSCGYRAHSGCDRRSAASVDRSTDASVVFERGARRTRPRLSVRQTRAYEASDVSIVEEVDRWILVAGTRGTRRSDGCYYAASVGLATDATMQRLSPSKIIQ